MKTALNNVPDGPLRDETATGPGLSLAYDIVKAHGGKLKVNTRKGEGTTFIVQ